MTYNNPGEYTEIEIPSWACDEWGQYGHDWLNCHKCLAKYDEEMNAGPNTDMTTGPGEKEILFV